MDSIIGYIPILGRLAQAGKEPTPEYEPGSSAKPMMELPPVEVHNVENSPEKRSRTLKHLLKANHANHSILYHGLQFDNHMAHILSSAYLLGADENQLHHIYEVQSKELEDWQPPPAEVTPEDWRDLLGKKNYQRGFLDFFEDRLVTEHKYHWKDVVNDFMFRGASPLGHCLIGGLGHPLIHLGYAFEMESKEVAMEALALTATQYDFLHKYADDPSYTRPSPLGRVRSPRDLLDRMAGDERLKSLFGSPGFDNFGTLFEKHEDLVLEYWNAWRPDEDAENGGEASPLDQFRDSQEAATALLVDTVPPGTRAYNFFVCHLLTTSHAVRILLPLVPPGFQAPLVRQWWLLVVAVYACRCCPRIADPAEGATDKSWKYVVDKAVNGPWCTDSHFVKAVRAMKEAARTWGDAHEQRYLNAAVRFVDEFDGWKF